MPPERSVLRRGLYFPVVSGFLEFTDPELETAYHEFASPRTFATTDLAVTFISLCASISSLLRLHAQDAIRDYSHLALLSHALLCVARIWLLQWCPKQYSRFRSLLVGAGRLSQAFGFWNVDVVTTAHNCEPYVYRGFWIYPAFQIFFASITLPLPLRTHLFLQGLVVMAMLWRTVGEHTSCPAMAWPSMATESAQQFWQRIRFLEIDVAPLSDNALAWWPMPQISSILFFDYFCTSIVMFALELVSRTRFLLSISYCQPHQPSAHLRSLRVGCIVGCGLLISLYPICLRALQRLTFAFEAQNTFHTNLAALTAIGVEAFMKIWASIVSSVCIQAVWSCF